MEDQTKIIFNQLRPVEKLFLLSKERPEIYSKKNRALSIITFLLGNKTLNLSSSGNKFKFTLTGQYPINEYERVFIEHIQTKNFPQLDTFINNLKFDKTLVEYGILKEEIQKKKILFIFPSAQTSLTKTTRYYEILAELTKNPSELTLFMDQRAHNFYNVIKSKIIESMKQAKEEQQKNNDEATDELFNMKLD